MDTSQSTSTSGHTGTPVALNGGLSRLRAIISAREFGIFAFLVLMIVFLSIARPTFLTSNNVLNMGRQMAQLTVMAVAMTFLITSQELDLSVGSVFGLCSMMMALLARDYGVDLWLSLLIVLGVAALIGIFNGLLVTYGRIPSFIVTLGMLYIVRGATLMLSSYPVARLEHPTFFNVLAGNVFGNVPIQIFWMLAFVVVGFLVMQRTTFGYHVRATGSNRAAAEISGIRVRRVKIIGFMLTSMTAAFAGALSFAHLTSVAPTAGTGTELTVIAAVVIGGTALFGGYGTVLGTFLGAALLTVIRNGLVQLGGDGRLQDAFLGAIIIIAVFIHTYLELRRR
jgi:simple sugar transport system permease protein/ribose transport system permease protein